MNKWYMHKPEPVLEILETNGSTNLGQTTRPSDSQKKKKKKKN